MKKLLLQLLVLFSFITAYAQKDSLQVHYYENYPFAYTENGKLKGIEIEIIEAYVNWAETHGMSVSISYKPYKEFSAFYNSVKDGGPNVVGLGSVTYSREREQEISFSAAYLKNVAVLITDGKVPTLKSRSAEEISRNMSGLSGMVVNKSSHVMYMNAIKAKFLPGLKIETVETQSQVLEKIAANANYFGYVDIIAYWAYVKKHADKFLKIQKPFNETNENLGFITPKKSNRISSLNEFFESGFGFTSTKAYHQILEKYLGYEIIESVEIK